MKSARASGIASARGAASGFRNNVSSTRSAANNEDARAALSRIRRSMAAGYHSRMLANRNAPLLAREPLEGAYALLTFRHPEVAAAARAGQYVMIKAGASADPPLRRPFSVMTVDPKEESFTIFLKAVGAGSRALAGLRVGETAACL